MTENFVLFLFLLAAADLILSAFESWIAPKIRRRKMLMKLILIVALLGMLGLAACGGGSSKVVTPPPNVVPVSISLTPNSATVVPSGKQQFLASVLNSDGSSTNNATLSATGQGTIDPATGIFQATASAGSATVNANAGSLFTSATVQIVAPTAAGPQFVQAVACGVNTLNTQCTWTAGAGNAFVYYLHSDTYTPSGTTVNLTDNQNDQLISLLVSGAISGGGGETEFGVAGTSVSPPIVGGVTTIQPPSGFTLFVVEYTNVSGLDSAPGFIQEGTGGNPTQTIYSFGYTANNANAVALVFVLAEYPGSLNAGASSTQHFQEENSSNLALVFFDQTCPTPAPYTLSFIPSDPATFNNVEQALFVLGLR